MQAAYDLTEQQAEPVLEHRVVFEGDDSVFSRLVIRNILLSIATLGFHYFWGQAQQRKYLFKNTQFLGEHLDYAGMGAEHLQRFLRVFVAMGASLLFLFFIPKWMELPFNVRAVLAAVEMICLVGILISSAYAAIRDFLASVLIGQVALQLSCNFWSFIEMNFRGVVFTIFSLGFYLPFYIDEVYAFIVNNICAGPMKFHYGSDTVQLRKLGWLSFGLFIPTLGLGSIYILARLLLLQLNSTWFGNAKLGAVKSELQMAPNDLGKYLFVNLGVMLMSFGLAAPLVAISLANQIARTVVFRGTIDLEQTRFSFATAPVFRMQSSVQASKRWQGFSIAMLAGLFYVGFKFELDRLRTPAIVTTPVIASEVVEDPNTKSLEEAKLLLDATGLELSGESKKALAKLNEVVALNPHNVNALIQRGVLKRKMRAFRSGNDDLKMAIRLLNSRILQNPTSAVNFASRGRAYEMKRDFGRAEKDYKKALELAPQNQTYKMNLRMLYTQMKVNQSKLAH